MPPKKTHEEFKKEFEAKFDGVLELRDTKYVSARENIVVYCLKHGAFEKTPTTLLHNKNFRHPCPKCVKEMQVAEVIDAWPSYLEKIKKAVNCEQLDFSQVEYKGSQKKIKIICKKHGAFQAIPAGMLNKKSGCPKCGQSKRKSLGKDTILERLNSIHGDKYEFNITDDTRTNSKISYICSKHGVQTALVTNLLSGKGCRQCGTEKTALKRTSSTDQWIAKAKKVHGDKYDYSKTKYKNAKTKVIVICQKHGPFEINPSNHLTLKRGCKGCSGRDFQNWDNKKKRLTQEQFLLKVNAVAPLNLDFSKSVYKKGNVKVTVTCKIHGDFKVLPTNLFNGQNCAACSREQAGKKKRIEKDVLINRLKNKFKNTYEIDEDSIKMATKPIRLKCKEHGWFEGLIGNLEVSQGCPVCTHAKAASIRNKKLALTREEIIQRFKRVHGNKYNYDQIDPKGTLSAVEIKCEKHGIFTQKVYTHFEGKGCPECGSDKKYANQRLTQNELYNRLQEIHQDLFIYPPNCGLDLQQTIPIICREHGIFYQPLRIHLDGNGCSECSQSLGARQVSHWLNNHEIFYEVEHPIPAGKKGLPLRADFYLPEFDLFIEYDGEQHFKPIAFFGMDEKTSLSVFKQQQERDKAKEDWILNEGFKLLRIRFDQDVSTELDKYFEVLN